MICVHLEAAPGLTAVLALVSLHLPDDIFRLNQFISGGHPLPLSRRQREVFLSPGTSKFPRESPSRPPVRDRFFIAFWGRKW